MRRILVPLDGTPMAESILPEAVRLAGPAGRLILVQDVFLPWWEHEAPNSGHTDAVQRADAYLLSMAASLQADGVDVETLSPGIQGTVWAIDQAPKILHADMIACATHGRTPLGRLIRGGVAWKALAQSTVPVLLRHAEDDEDRHAFVPSSHRHIMVPLDGSALGEAAIPLAQELAIEWNASLYLTRVARYPLTPTTMALQAREFVQEARGYLDTIARSLVGDVHTGVLVGPMVPTLTKVVHEQSVTDIVMASHGRTGLARVLLGSVADGLIHNLHCPIIVVPALAAAAMKDARDVVTSEQPVLVTL
ncbi:MAG: universal stress protein [Chloroflexota bacterium]